MSVKGQQAQKDHQNSNVNLWGKQFSHSKLTGPSTDKELNFYKNVD